MAAHRSSEHQALITGSAGVNTLCNVRRLCSHCVNDTAGIRIIAVRSIVIADLMDRIANDLLVVDLGRRCDFPGNDRQTRGNEGFASYSARNILFEDSVENRVGDLVSNFVRVSFGNRLGRE